MDGISAAASVNVQDAYTDLNSLNKLKSQSSDVALKKVAQEFESIFINIMLKSMRDANAVFEKDSLTQSNESQMYRDMYDQQLALNLSKGKGLGIADVLYRQLKGQYGELAEKHDMSLDARATERASYQPMLMQQTRVKNSTTQNEVERAHAVSAASVADDNQKHGFDDQQSFVEQLLPVAKSVAGSVGLNPVMMLAQAALETGWGKHLVKSGKELSYNLFNIKADASWQGQAVNKTTLEYKDGVAVKEAAQFRKYDSFSESLQDFVQFLQDNPRYQTALENTEDSETFIKELHKAGYATDPEYSDKVLSVYQRLQTMLAGAE